MLDIVIYSGTEGVELDYTFVDAAGNARDISAATVKTITIVTPDGASNAYTAAFFTNGSDGKIKYVVSVIGQVGLWKYRGTYETASGSYPGEWVEFYVREPSPVDATWGGDSANSYISVVSANAFITSSIVDSSAWTDSTIMQRAAALIEATRDIDSHDYLGCRYYSDQMLLFPREFSGQFPWNRTIGPNNFSTEQTRMQTAVEQATCYQALSILRKGGRDTHQERILSGIERFKQVAGQAEEDITYRSGGSSSRLCPDAINRLRSYRGQKSVFRG